MTFSFKTMLADGKYIHIPCAPRTRSEGGGGVGLDSDAWKGVEELGCYYGLFHAGLTRIEDIALTIRKDP